MIDLRTALKMAARLETLPPQFGQAWSKVEYARIIVTYGTNEQVVSAAITELMDTATERPSPPEFKLFICSKETGSTKSISRNSDCPICSGTGYEIVLVRTERAEDSTGRLVDKNVEVIPGAVWTERTGIQDRTMALWKFRAALEIQLSEQGQEGAVHESAVPCKCGETKGGQYARPQLNGRYESPGGPDQSKASTNPVPGPSQE